ncbi:uncharacterized protein LOC121573640 [Coregonus clupeaformis]|uniref:uncharacterized protein LOC121573640 n=1 Tax=Coregonus clupeaformis TaxID=59861 RepID=UPI001BE1233F|nr:uncharacterized protein LOC121573640 [Coregonus clupeaformis]
MMEGTQYQMSVFRLERGCLAEEEVVSLCLMRERRLSMCLKGDPPWTWKMALDQWTRLTGMMWKGLDPRSTATIPSTVMTSVNRMNWMKKLNHLLLESSWKEQSYSSCYSLDSDDCETRTRKSRSSAPKAEGPAVELPPRPELIKNPDEKRHPALTVDFTFKAIRKTLEKLGQDDLRKFKITLWNRYPESFSAPPQGMDMVDLVDRLLECYDLEVALQLTKALLKDMGLKRLADFLTDICKRNEVRYELRLTLLRKYSSMHEGFAQQGDHKAFDSIFNELYITDGGNAGPNIQHEVRKIDKLSTNHKKVKLITCR